MKKFLGTMLAVAMVTCTWNAPASAAVIYWDGAGSNPASPDWNTASNWQVAGQPVPTGAVPGGADHVIIHNDNPVGPDASVNIVVPNINIFTPQWHNGQNTVVNIQPGGSLGVANFARLSGGNNGSSTINFAPGAGVSVWSLLQMSFNNAAGGIAVPGTESDSFINLDGGILHLGSLGFSNNGLNTTNIDLGLGGTLLVNGDHTAQPWVGNGWITGIDGTGVVNAVYDADNARTVFTASAIPEPASLALLGLGSLVLLGARRRR